MLTARRTIPLCKPESALQVRGMVITLMTGGVSKGHDRQQDAENLACRPLAFNDSSMRLPAEGKDRQANFD